MARTSLWMLLSPTATEGVDLETARTSLRLRAGQSIASKWLIWAVCAVTVWALREPLGLPVLLAWALPVMAMAEANARMCTRLTATLDAAAAPQLRRHQVVMWGITLLNQSLMASTVWWFGSGGDVGLATTATALQTVYTFAALANAGTHPPTFVSGAWINLLSALVYWNTQSALSIAVNLSVLGGGLMLTRLAHQMAATLSESLHIRYENQGLLRQLASEKQALEDATHLKLQFLTNISHSVRTPVSAILNMAYLTLKSDLSPRQREFLQVIDQCAHHLRGLVNQVLDFSKMEAGMLQLHHARFELSQVLKQALAMAEPAATAKGLQLSLVIAPDTPEHLVGDELRLTEVLLNLVSNGVKFTDRGGVRVQVACMTQTPERVQLRLSVSDTGRGLTAVQLQQLFKRFSQVGGTDVSPVGSGLGLEIAKMLVNLMGGDVGARSTPGVGSEFWCTPWFSVATPATPTTLASPPANPSPAPAVPTPELANTGHPPAAQS